MNGNVTFAWNRSAIEFTKTTRGFRHRNGSSSVCGCIVTAKPGPEVLGSPSFWYFSEPIAFKRFANVIA
jgi:hypothetical protein